MSYVSQFQLVGADGITNVSDGGSFQVVAPATVLAATSNSADITNPGYRGGILVIDVTAATGTTPTLAVQVQAKDPVTGKYVNVPGAVTASLTGVSTTPLAIYPGLTETANARVSYPLPKTFRLSYTVGGTTPSFTLGVGLIGTP